MLNDEFLSLLFPGEYITLYQTQRSALKSYYKDRERMIAQLSSEKANMQVSVFVYLTPAHSQYGMCESPTDFMFHLVFFKPWEPQFFGESNFIPCAVFILPPALAILMI